MKKGILSVVLMGIMALVCATCQGQVGLTEQDRAAIRKVSDQAVGMAVGPNVDWGAYVNLYYAEDAKVFVPGLPILEGREAIKAAFAAMGALQEEKWTSLEIEGRGDLAYERGTYSMTIIPPGMSTATTEIGKDIVVWQRQKDGTWKAIRDIWNPDSAPAGLTLPTSVAQPGAGPELARLNWLAGNWTLEGESAGSPFIPAGKVAATIDARWFPGGNQLLVFYNMMYPNGAVQELSTYGYDPGTKSYWNYDFDSTGLNAVGKVLIQDSGWTHVWDYRVGGKPVKMRLLFSDITPNGCTWKNEYSEAGGPWTPLAQGTGTKVK